MTQTSRTRILVLGSKAVGKSAISIRFLTKRFIGEYQSNGDLYYRRVVLCDRVPIDVEILDFSRNDERCNSLDIEEVLLWADGYIIVYSICDESSFKKAEEYLKLVSEYNRRGTLLPIILLGNKRDLEVGRKVNIKAGMDLALKYNCQFYEISAADNHFGISLAFNHLIRKIHFIDEHCDSNLASYEHKSCHKQSSKRLSLVTISKVFGAMFGRQSSILVKIANYGAFHRRKSGSHSEAESNSDSERTCRMSLQESSKRKKFPSLHSTHKRDISAVSL